MKLDFKNYPLIMGVLNVTPDSFSDGGNYNDSERAKEHAMKMIDDGADIIDIGGESTRPGADPVPEKEEINRVIPVIEDIKRKNPDIPVSVDTTKYEVARLALEAGADIINDISGLTFDIRLAELTAKYNKWLIIMHIKGTPRNMQINPVYADPVTDIFQDLSEKIKTAKKYGANKIIADVGIGFGKTYYHNLTLLNNHIYFRNLGVPLLIGISRKSFIGKMLDIEKPEERDIPTALIHALIISQKTDIIRVHDVSTHVLLKKIYKKIKKI